MSLRGMRGGRGRSRGRAVGGIGVGSGAVPAQALPLNTTETAAADELVAPAEPIAAVHAADDMDADAEMQAGQTVRGQGRAVGGVLGALASHSVGSELKAQAMLVDPPPPSAPATPGMRRSRSPGATHFEGRCAWGARGQCTSGDMCFWTDCPQKKVLLSPSMSPPLKVQATPQSASKGHG